MRPKPYIAEPCFTGLKVFIPCGLLFALVSMYAPSDLLIWLFAACFVGSAVCVVGLWIDLIRYVNRPRTWLPEQCLRDMADGEDEAGSVSVGGMAADMGMPLPEIDDRKEPQ